jgi:hypothetical protein
LNIAETVWRKLKKEWFDPQDYLEKTNSSMQLTDGWQHSVSKRGLNLAILIKTYFDEVLIIPIVAFLVF